MTLGTSGDGIKFGKHCFSEPEPLAYPTAPWILDRPGLYVVLVYASNWRPRPYRPLYFGESHGVRGRATTEHENYQSWLAEAGQNSNLFRALCFLPGSTRLERQMAESALIGRYHPPCNDRASVNLAALLGLYPR